MLMIDTHAHLQSDDFRDDWQAVLDRAAEQSVGYVILPGSNLEDSRRACEMAASDSRLFFTAGVHPHEAKQYDQAAQTALEALIQSAPDCKLVAIGEIGLDYHYDISPRSQQQAVFRSQIELAARHGLPLVIHLREATADSLALLETACREGLLRPEAPGVIHCFSGSPETAERLLEMGFYLGFDGPVTFKNARRALDVVRICPHDRLVIETDSPYLTPVPYRGKRNEPTHLPLIAEKIAELWDSDIQTVARQTTDNARKLFRIRLESEDFSTLQS